MQQNDTDSLVAFGDWIKKNAPGHSLLEIPGVDGVPVQVIVSPGQGANVASLKKFVDEYRDRPERREGTAAMQDLPSFIAHVNRFKDVDSALFLDASNRDKPTLTAVLDYHERVNDPDGAPEPGHHPDSLPRFGKHRTLYAFPVSDEWTAWQAKNGKPMEQGIFAAFIEERGIDILPPPVFDGELSESDKSLKQVASLLRGKFAGPERMMDLSRGLAVYETSKVRAATNLSSGEGSVVFETEHADENGQKLEVPNLFLIGIPVFKLGTRYRVLVRLRYRKQDGKLSWYYDLYRADLVLDDALATAAEVARAKTGLPLFYGKPESSRYAGE